MKVQVKANISKNINLFNQKWIYLDKNKEELCNKTEEHDFKFVPIYQ